MALTVEQLEKKVIELANLPTLPGILTKVARMTASDESSPADVAQIIASDQVLSAKVLRLVNSPVYGFPGRISSVTHAVVLLGFNVVKGLILGTAVFNTLGNNGQGLWKHSLGCALCCKQIANELGYQDTEEFMVMGLLHDLGKVALMYLLPGQYAMVSEKAEQQRCHVAEMERDVFQVDHARVGSWIAREWHFPARLTDAITYHHKPERAKDSVRATAVVHLADILARGLDYGHPGDCSMPPFDGETVAQLGLSPEQFEGIIESAEVSFSTGADVFALGD